MGKYLYVLSIGLQNTLVYRANFLFRAAFGLIPLAGTLFLWRAIYAGKPPGDFINGYSLAEMISYYLILTLVDAFTAVAEDDWQIAGDIKDGQISQFLLKPIDYLKYRLSLYAAGRVIYTTCALLPVAIFLAFQWEAVVGPASGMALAQAILATFLAGLLQFLIAYTVALLAFWVLDVSTFIFTQFALEYIASGHLFPLDLLPPILHQALLWTPYPYLAYFPVGVYLGRIPTTAAWTGLAVQVTWVLAGLYSSPRDFSPRYTKILGSGRLVPTMKTIRRYAAVYGALVKYSLVHEMQFKVNFLLWIVVECLWFGLQLAFMAVLYSHTESIAGWSRWEVILLLGCNQIVQQLFHVLFVTNLSNLSELIRRGTLDLLILQPMNPRFLVSLKKFEIGNVANALLGVAVVGWALMKLGHSPTAWEWIGFCLVCVVGLIIHYSLTFMLACVAFWVVRAQGILWAYYNLFNIARLPAEAFPPGLYRAFFSWVIPMLLVSNVPARLLAGTLTSPGPLILLVAIAIATLALSELMWRWALKQYTSASS